VTAPDTGSATPTTDPVPTRDAPARRRAGVGPLARIFLLVSALALVAIAAMSVGSEDGPTGVSPDGAEPAGDGPAASDATPSEGAPSPTTDPTEPEADPTEPEADPTEPEADDGTEAGSGLHAELFATRDASDPRAVGDVDAPVVMIEWGDFLCGYCARFALETEPELIERYVDTGVLRIEWRDLPLQGDGAWISALGGRAAAEQDAFWAFHGHLYADALADRSVRFTRDGLLEVADGLGLDVAAFEATLDDPDVAEHVAAEARQAQQLGISGTPAFLINDQPVMGAQPLQVFAGIIESAAAERGVTVP